MWGTYFAPERQIQDCEYHKFLYWLKPSTLHGLPLDPLTGKAPQPYNDTLGKISQLANVINVQFVISKLFRGICLHLKGRDSSGNDILQQTSFFTK